MYSIAKTTLFSLLLCCSTNLISQNLVLNGEFEDKRECPEDFVKSPDTKYPVREWSIPTSGTADYMHKCGKKNVSAPKNHAGYQKPRSSDGYIRIICGKFNFLNYIEYIQGELSTPLIKDEEYNVEFWVSLGEESLLTSNCIGAHISEKRIGNKKRTNNIKVSPQIKCEDFITDYKKWTKISGIYTARGGEKYITLGVFLTKDEKNYKFRKQGNWLYLMSLALIGNYYIDDISVTPVKEPEEVLPVGNKDSIVVNVPVILENVHFETGSYTLTKNSYAELNYLDSLLRNNESILIELSGHTDNIGNEKDNNELSLLRAEEIKKYLSDCGIDENRISCKGYGSSKPISDNTSETGKQTNRRVEITFNKKAGE